MKLEFTTETVGFMSWRKSANHTLLSAAAVWFVTLRENKAPNKDSPLCFVEMIEEDQNSAGLVEFAFMFQGDESRESPDQALSQCSTVFKTCVNSDPNFIHLPGRRFPAAIVAVLLPEAAVEPQLQFRLLQSISLSN